MELKNVKAKHFARTWAALLDTLETPDGSCSCEDMIEILRAKEDKLLHNVNVFKERSPESDAKIKEGTLGGTTLHRSWRDFVLQLSEALELDALQAFELLRQYLTEQKQTLQAKDIKLDDVIEFYYFERSCLLGCICAVLRIFLADFHHMYFEAARECLDSLVKRDLEKQIVSRYTKSCALLVPKTKAMERFEAATRWADHIVNEQALLLEILFMLYYKIVACTFQKTVEIARVVQAQNFGKQQQLYTYLSDRGRRTVEWIGYLCVLIIVEALQLEDLTRVWEIDDTKSRQEALTAFDQHKLTKKEHLEQLDHEFFSQSWTGLPLHGPVLLAWAVFLAHVFEFKEEITADNASYEEQDLALQRKQIVIERLEMALRLDPFSTLHEIIRGMHRGELRRDGPDPNLAAYKSIVKGLLWGLFQSTCYPAVEQSPQHHKLFGVFSQIFTDETDLCIQFWERDVKTPLVRPLLDDAIRRFPLQPVHLLEMLTALCGAANFAKKPQALEDRDLWGESVGTVRERSEEEITAEQLQGLCARQAYNFLLNMKRYTSILPPPDYIEVRTVDDQKIVVLIKPWVSPDGLLVPAKTVGEPIFPNDGTFVQWWLDWSAWPLLIKRLQKAIRTARTASSTVSSSSSAAAAYFTPTSPEQQQQELADVWPTVAATVHLLFKIVSADAKLFAELQAHVDAAAQAAPSPNVIVTVIPAAASGALTRGDSKEQSSGGGGGMSRSSSSNALPMMIDSIGTTGRSDSKSGATTKARAVQMTTMMLKLLRFLAVNSAKQSGVSAASAPAGSGPAPMSDDALESLTVSDLAELRVGELGLDVPLPLLARVLRSCVGVLVAAARTNARQFAHQLLFTFSESSEMLAVLPQASSSGSLSPAASFAAVTRLILNNIESPQGLYPATTGVLEILTLLVPHQHKWQIESPSLAKLPELAGIPTAGFLGSLDMHALIKLVCTDIFVSYDSWRYQRRSERWQVGLKVLKLFHAVLSAPGDSGYLVDPLAKKRVQKRVSLRQYLFDLFVSEAAMQRALLKPIAIGSGIADKLVQDRKMHECDLLEDLIVHTFLVVHQILRIQKAERKPSVHAFPRAAGAEYGVSDMEDEPIERRPPAPSFAQVLLDSFATHGSTEHARSLAQNIVPYANYKRSTELQVLAIQTITFLCLPADQAHSLAGYLGPTVSALRKACHTALTARKVQPAMREAVLDLLATSFEYQPGLAERFLKLSYSIQQTVTQGLTGTQPAQLDESKGPLTKESVLTPVKDYVANAKVQFEKEPAILAKAYHILYSLWQAAPGYQNVAHHLKQEPTFWENLLDCLTVDVPRPALIGVVESKRDDAKAAAPTQASLKATKKYCDQLNVRAWALQILTLELYTTPPAQLQDALKKVLAGFIEAGQQEKWLLQYTRCDEDPNVTQLVDMSQELNIDMAVFLSMPSNIASTASSDPVYDVDMLSRTLYEELEDPDATGEAVVQRRQKMADFITKLRNTNRSWLIADSQLVLLRSWKMFIQVALLRHPGVLGIVPNSFLPWRYLNQLSESLVEETRHGEGYMVTLSTQEISGVFFMMLSHFVGAGADSNNTRILSTSIVLDAALESPEWKQIAEAKAQGDGHQDKVVELLATKSTHLLARIAQCVERCARDYLPAQAPSSATTHLASQRLRGVTGQGATSSALGDVDMETESEAQAQLVSSLQQTIMMGFKLDSAGSASSSSSSAGTAGMSLAAAQAVAGPGSVSPSASASGSLYHKSMLLLQTLQASSLVLIRWASVLLALREHSLQFPNASDNAQPLTTLGSLPDKGKAPPSSARRLASAFQTSTLHSISEAKDAAAESSPTKAVVPMKDTGPNPSQELAAACEVLLPVACACVTQPVLTTVCVSLLPVALDALDSHHGDGFGEGRQTSSSAHAHTSTPHPALQSGVAAVSAVVPSLLRQLSSTPLSDPASALRIVQLFCSLSQKSRGAAALLQHSLLLYLCNHEILRPSREQLQGHHTRREREQKAREKSASAGSAGSEGLSLSSSFGGGLFGGDSVENKSIGVGYVGYHPSYAQGYAAEAATRPLRSGVSGGSSGIGLPSSLGGGVSGLGLSSGAGFGATAAGISELAASKRSDDPCAPYLYASPAAAATSGPGAASTPAAAAVHASGTPTSDKRGGSRNGWHRVWCSVISLVTNLMRALPGNSRLLDEVLEFMTVFHPRLASALDASQSEAITLARLEEAEQVTSLLYELERYGAQWRFRLSQVAAEHRRSILQLTQTYIRLFSDPYVLSQRAVAVDREEQGAFQTDLLSATGKVSATAKKSSSSSSTWSSLATSSTPEKASAILARSEQKDAKENKERKTDSPTKRLAPDSPSGRNTSWLLRSPAIHRMREESTLRRAGSQLNDVEMGDKKKSDEFEQQQTKDFELFSQRVEFAICLVLRNALSFLLLLTQQYAETGPVESDLLFNDQLKVIHSFSGIGAPGSLGARGLGEPQARHSDTPPLAILLDLQASCIKVLVRLGDIQARDQTGALTLTRYPSLITSSSSVSPSSAPSSTLPTFLGIRAVINSLLECGLYLLLEHAQIFLRRMLALPHTTLSERDRLMRERDRQLDAQFGFGYAAGQFERRPEQPLTPEEHEAINRAKALDTYREKLLLLVQQLRKFTAREEASEFIIRLTEQLTGIVRQLETRLAELNYGAPTSALFSPDRDRVTVDSVLASIGGGPGGHAAGGRPRSPGRQPSRSGSLLSPHLTASKSMLSPSGSSRYLRSASTLSRAQTGTMLSPQPSVTRLSFGMTPAQSGLSRSISSGLSPIPTTRSISNLFGS